MGYLCPMQATKQLLEKLSKLSMLRFTEAESAEMGAELEKMISFIDKLRELDTTGVEPLLHMSHNMDLLREDQPSGMISHKEALSNAPHHDGIYFKVPQVIKKPR